MADNLTPNERSKLMSKVSGRDTKPEMIVRKFLYKQRIRYRLHVKSLPGTPDIVIKKYKKTIFVHGCFWHGHENCRASRLPSTNFDFWKSKREKNLDRDRRNNKELVSQGWKVLVVWECEIKNKNSREKRLSKLLQEIIN